MILFGHSIEKKLGTYSFKCTFSIDENLLENTKFCGFQIVFNESIMILQ